MAMNNIGTWVAHFVRPCKQKKSYMRVWLPCVQAYEIRLRIYHIRERYGKDIFLWLAYLTVDGKNIAISLRDLNAPTQKRRQPLRHTPDNVEVKKLIYSLRDKNLDGVTQSWSTPLRVLTCTLLLIIKITWEV